MTVAADGFARVAGPSPARIAEGSLHAGTLPGGGRLCLGRHQGALFAVKDHCPHAEFPLSEGSLLASGEIECAWHGARFDCRTGALRHGPADLPLVRYELEERDGELWARRVPRGAEEGR
jgi:nitrite reductase/ring-hydroxylating ferredoxin subunit